MQFLLTFYLIGSIAATLIFHYGVNKAVKQNVIPDDSLVINLAYIFVFFGSWLWIIYMIAGDLDE